MKKIQAISLEVAEYMVDVNVKNGYDVDIFEGVLLDTYIIQGKNYNIGG